MMPVKKGTKGRNMGATNKLLRTEIENDIVNKVKVADISRTANSIKTSQNFHLDAVKLSDGAFKVEIQYKKGTKQTVAVAQVQPGSSDANMRSGLLESLKDGFTYLVS
jgi:hypothetical protein